MAIVIPEYLSKKNLPLASDIFFHQNIIYFLPTGFHHIEINNVLDFPNYCREKEVALPYIIQDSCKLYFEADKQSLECAEILKPFRRRFLKFVLPIYPRGRKEIEDCKVILEENPDIYEDFKETALDLTFVSRELLSHILYEIFLEEGYEGAVEYIKENMTSVDNLLFLIAAVLINRLRIFSKMDTDVLIYNHSWYPVFSRISNLLNEDQVNSSSDSFLVDQFQYKLFESILYPVFGYCDLISKNEEIAKIAKEKVVEINYLKEECMSIAEEVVLLPTTDNSLRQRRLSNLINKRIVEPLRDITNRPARDIDQIIKDFLLDSTVVGGLIATIQKPDPTVFKVALAAGAISAAARYLFRDKSLEKNIPSEIILEGITKMKIDYEQIQDSIRGILIDDTAFPEKWK